MTYKQCNFRKSYKLNPQNVFPGPFARMKVRYAAQVLSATVARDLASQNWEGVGETVKFIELCDKFFDVLNGAHSSQAGRQRKPDLAASTFVSDSRFDWLENVFLKYLKDWELQVDSMPIDEADKEKKMLSRQTLVGVEITIRGFIAATKYFLEPEKGNGKFLMARVYSQDPLEQEFSKQRAGGGGNRNPNAKAFQSKMVVLGVHRDIGMKSKRGNVTNEDGSGMTFSAEPVPKKPRTSKKK